MYTCIHIYIYITYWQLVFSTYPHHKMKEEKKDQQGPAAKNGATEVTAIKKSFFFHFNIKYLYMWWHVKGNRQKEMRMLPPQERKKKYKRSGSSMYLWYISVTYNHANYCQRGRWDRKSLTNATIHCNRGRERGKQSAAAFRQSREEVSSSDPLSVP